MHGEGAPQLRIDAGGLVVRVDYLDLLVNIDQSRC